MHLTPIYALSELKKSSSLFVELFKHGSLSVEIYQPYQQDFQKPHNRDEVYVITGGQAMFKHNDSIVKVHSGDFLFVPAGDMHYFFDFTNDFSTWVIFYGPIGGELNTSNHVNEK